jgi:hypothetical protein
MSKAGDFFQNPVTGEAAIVRIGTEESDGELLLADLYIAPGGAVMGEHYHPAIEERLLSFAVNLEFGCPDAQSRRRPALCCSSLPAFRTTGGTPGRKMRSFALKFARVRDLS